MEVRRGRLAGEDAYCVTKLRRAGAVILGKLHLHEAALGADSDNPWYGRCHNPQRIGDHAGWVQRRLGGGACRASVCAQPG